MINRRTWIRKKGLEMMWICSTHFVSFLNYCVYLHSSYCPSHFLTIVHHISPPLASEMVLSLPYQPSPSLQSKVSCVLSAHSPTKARSGKPLPHICQWPRISLWECFRLVPLYLWALWSLEPLKLLASNVVALLFSFFNPSPNLTHISVQWLGLSICFCPYKGESCQTLVCKNIRAQ